MLFSRALHFVLASLRTKLKHLYFLVRGCTTVGIRENAVKDTAVCFTIVAGMFMHT